MTTTFTLELAHPVATTHLGSHITRDHGDELGHPSYHADLLLKHEAFVIRGEEESQVVPGHGVFTQVRSSGVPCEARRERRRGLRNQAPAPDADRHRSRAGRARASPVSALRRRRRGHSSGPQALAVAASFNKHLGLSSSKIGTVRGSPSLTVTRGALVASRRQPEQWHCHS